MSGAERSMILRMIRILASAIGWIAVGKKERAHEMVMRVEWACDFALETALDEAANCAIPGDHGTMEQLLSDAEGMDR